jgi:hypothetical protein
MRDSDDDFLSDNGITPMPPGYVPILTGYVYCCKMYRRKSSSENLHHDTTELTAASQ